jgi:hypothetical protein
MVYFILKWFILGYTLENFSLMTTIKLGFGKINI